MAAFKEIVKGNGSGITTFYRLDQDKDTVEATSTGTSDTMFDYNSALNKPSVNGVALVGNKTSEELGLQPAGDYITEIPSEYITEEELEAKDYADKKYVIEAVNDAEHFHREIVEGLPVTGKDNVLYMVKKEGTEEDIYSEYIWVGTGYELVGTSAADLSNMYTKEETDKLLDNKVDKVVGKGLSENNYTKEEKDKLASLINYDDSNLKNRVNALETNATASDKKLQDNVYATEALQNQVNNVASSLSNLEKENKDDITSIRLVGAGDSWVFYTTDNTALTFEQAREKLGTEKYILVIEPLEMDGKILPAIYSIEDNLIRVEYTDVEGVNNFLNIVSDATDIYQRNPYLINNLVIGVDNMPSASTQIEGSFILVKLNESDDTASLFMAYKGEWVPFDRSGKIDITNYLAKDNTTPYAPTENYNPATKLYVDSSIADIHVPTKVSQLENDLDFARLGTTKLENYYPKSATYTKAEVNNLVASSGGGGGTGGTTNYALLSNKPKINGVELAGDINSADLGIEGTPEVYIQNTQPDNDNWKIWINPDEAQSVGSEVVNTLVGNETSKAPSVKAVNDKIKTVEDKVNDIIIPTVPEVEQSLSSNSFEAVPSVYAAYQAIKDRGIIEPEWDTGEDLEGNPIKLFTLPTAGKYIYSIPQDAMIQVGEDNLYCTAENDCILIQNDNDVYILGKDTGFEMYNGQSGLLKNFVLISLHNDKYSTDEQVIGRWINGKPIYRKVIESSVGEFNNVIESLKIEKVVREYGGGAEPVYGGIWNVPNTYLAEPQYQCYFAYNGKIVFGDFYTKSDGYCTATIEYTKTTD